MSKTSYSACVLIIGNEILSGRTQDVNLNYIATRLGARGIPVREARCIPDIPEVIVSAVNECRTKYDFVFTTGGIGPTHDDITAECVAKAFEVPLERHPEAMRLLEEHYKNYPGGVNESRARMANVPKGGELLRNPVSKAPGFRIGNVHVMAGVPSIMQAMFDTLLPTLPEGDPVVMKSVSCRLREGDIAVALEAIQNRYPDLDIGSYPALHEGQPQVTLVAKGQDADAVGAAAQEIADMVRGFGEEPQLS
jgi:molybdenum cofactor synthesis domain-containing protein